MEPQQETRDEKPLTFADIGIPTGPKLEEGALGKKRPLKDLEKKEIAFAVISVLSSLVATGLAIQRLATTSNGNPDFTFALIIIINALFCIYYVIHGLLAERPYEVIVMVLATFAVLIYIIVNYIMSTQNDVKLARLVLACVLSPIIIILGVIIAKEYHDSGRLIFRTVGADSMMQGFCKILFLFLGLQKFDLQPLFVVLGDNGTSHSAVWNQSGHGGHYHSVHWGPCHPHLLCTWIPVDIPQHNATSTAATATPTPTFNPLSGTTFFSAGLALFIRVVMGIYFLKSVLNFGHGLKYKVYGGTEPPRTNIEETASPE